MEAWARLGLYLFAAYGVLALMLALIDRLGRLSTHSGRRSPLSLVLLVHNNEMVIEQVVRSIAGSSWFAACFVDDIVIVDDHSSDGTPLLLERLAQRYGRLKVVKMSESPTGLPALEVGLFLTSNPVGVVCDLRNPREVVSALHALFVLLHARDHGPEVKQRTTTFSDN